MKGLSTGFGISSVLLLSLLGAGPVAAQGVSLQGYFERYGKVVPPAAAGENSQSNWLVPKSAVPNGLKSPSGNLAGRLPRLAPGGQANVPPLRRAGTVPKALANIPAHVVPNPNGPGWVCETGYRRLNRQCVPVEVPEHAALDASGHGWECDPGFRRQAQECVDANAPRNAPVASAGVPRITPRAAPGATVPRPPSVTLKTQDQRSSTKTTATVVIGRF